MPLSPSEKQTLLKLARKAIEEYLVSGQKIDPPEERFLQEPSGAFVTLKIDGNLRGCIGMTEARYPLGETIVHCAIAAATEDPRFRPLSLEELKRCHIEISLLSPLKNVSRVEEIEVGTHGLVVTLGPYRGLLLPQVAVEYGWDREQFLQHTCLKAGLPVDAWKTPAIKLEVFTAEVFGEEDTEGDQPPVLQNQ